MTARRRWLRRGGVLLGGTALLGVGFLLWLPTCFATPPPLTTRPIVLDQEVTTDPDGTTRLGAAWFRRREGASLLSIEGDPFTLGYSNARLTRALLAEQERSLMTTVRGFVPSEVGLWTLATVILVNNRSLPEFVLPSHRLEILGLARAGQAEDPYPQFGPRYHRVLNYHAAHDIAHWVWDKPVVACTAFAARRSATRGGRLIVGRNFDFEAGAHFDRNKVIARVRPTTGHAFLSVAWPGMAGAVTGLNEAGLFCAINGAHSSDRARIGTPVSLVVRRVLQEASTIAEAVAIVRAARVFVNDAYLIASAREDDAVVVEKTPHRTAVRRMNDDRLLLTNHFQSEALATDPGNVEHQRVGTSVARHARLSERLVAAHGRLDPTLAVDVLRDRRGVGGKALALGNRSAIDALIATHGVVADLTRGILWVSRGPHLLGRYDAYSIKTFGGPAPAPPIAADRLATTDAASRLRQARALIAASAANPAEHLDDLRSALTLNPGDPHALLLLARGWEALGDPGEAKAHYQAAQDASPPFGPDRAEIDAALKRLD